jgi:hypothetical protein
MTAQPTIVSVEVIPAPACSGYIDGWSFDPKRPCLGALELAFETASN